MIDILAPIVSQTFWLFLSTPVKLESEMDKVWHTHFISGYNTYLHFLSEMERFQTNVC